MFYNSEAIVSEMLERLDIRIKSAKISKKIEALKNKQSSNNEGLATLN
jgi:hypothetical protein